MRYNHPLQGRVDILEDNIKTLRALLQKLIEKADDELKPQIRSALNKLENIRNG